MLVLSEEHIMIRDSVRGFLQENAPVSQIRSLRDSEDESGYVPEIWNSMAELGLVGICVPEEIGGASFGYHGVAVVCEEIGRTLTATPFVSTALLSAQLLQRANPQDRPGWLSEIIEGSVIGALAIEEEGGTLEHCACCAVKSDSGYTISGEKVHVVDGNIADFFIVVARTRSDGDGLSLFRVERTLPGISVESRRNIDSRYISRITLDEVEVPVSALLGTEGEANDALRLPLSGFRLAQAAEMLGIAEEVMSRTLDYLRERQQFGVTIGTFQALQHRMAIIYCQVEMLRSAVLAAADACDGDKNIGQPVQLSQLAKLKAIDVARLAVNEAVQLHGGMGMTDEVDIGLFVKRVRCLAEQFESESNLSDCVASAQGF